MSNHRNPPTQSTRTIFAAISMLASRASGDVRCRRTLRPEATSVGVGGNVLVQLGLRAIPFGIAAVILGFVLKSVGTQARPADTALPGSRLSVFGTIHPDIFRLSAPLGSKSAGDRIRVASLEPQVGLFDALAKSAPMLTDTSTSACPNAPFEERFFGSADDCAASFDERFGPPVRVLASNPLPPDQHVENRRADALPKATVSK